MALYYPTNVIPSSYTKVAVDANSTMEISWQVNGNSAMTAFQIDFYKNDYASTYVASVGRTSDNIPQGGFYGTDRLGKPQFFTWRSTNNTTWKEFLQDENFNGNEYKYKITQWYDGQNNVLQCVTTEALMTGKIYYFTNNSGISGFDAVVLSVPENREKTNNKTIYYSLTTGDIWIDDSVLDRIVICSGNSVKSGAVPPGSTKVGYGAQNVLNTIFVSQTSSNVISAQAAPTLSIYRSSTGEYQDKINLLENVIVTVNSTLAVGSNNYFYLNRHTASYVSFIVTNTAIPKNVTIFYNTTQQRGYYYNTEGEVVELVTTVSEDQPTTGNNLGEASINIQSAIGYFKADYAPATGNPIRWIRWQVATATYNTETQQWVLGETLSDTGNIYTPALNYEFSGFFNGRQYAIRAIGESESNQQVYSESDNSDGWIFFNVKNEKPGRYTGKLSVQRLCRESAALVEWEGVEAIPPVVNPNGYIPLVSLGTVSLAATRGNTEYSVAWDKILKYNTETGQNEFVPMNFSAPGTVAVKGRICDTAISTRNLLFETTVPPNSSKTVDYHFSLPAKAISTTYHDPSSLSSVYISDDGLTVSATFVNRSPSPSDRSLVAPIVVATQNSFVKGEIVRINGESELNKIELSFSMNESTYSDRVFRVLNKSFSVNNDAVNYCFMVDSNLMARLIQYDVDSAILQDNTLLLGATIELSAINSLQIMGGDAGAVFNSVATYSGLISTLNIPIDFAFEPVWNSSQYQIYFAANFNGNLQGGTGTTTGAGFRLYRQELGANILTPIATVPSNITTVKDFGIVSHKAYRYSLYAFDNEGAFMDTTENDAVIASCLNSYSLLVCDYDEQNDEYHVRKQYLFALNLSTGSVGNNNSPTLNANFTRYPTRMPSAQNYASGTLTGLIGAIYTVPALIEQIGNYKRTTKPSTIDYFDNVDLEQELYDLSTAPYQLFLRDMKGRLRMIHTSAPITMTTNIKQKQQSISMSLPWVEIGDASDVTIIQTPEDYGWNNDSQVLDVSLDVDVETGELSATYPFPYNGTKFYLTGVNKETLTAKTPLGITPAQFDLSETATQPDDGELNATVKVNSEENA